MPYGFYIFLFSFIFFRHFGLCLVMPSRVVELLVGRLLVALGVLLCGRCCLIVSCGAFRRKRMIEILRIARGCWRSLTLFSSILSIFRQMHLFLSWCSVIMGLFGKEFCCGFFV